MKRITPTRSLVNKYDIGGPSTPTTKVDSNYCTLPPRKSSSKIEPWAGNGEVEGKMSIDMRNTVMMYHETVNRLRDIRGVLYKNGIDPESLKQ